MSSKLLNLSIFAMMAMLSASCATTRRPSADEVVIGNEGDFKSCQFRGRAKTIGNYAGKSTSQVEASTIQLGKVSAAMSWGDSMVPLAIMNSGQNTVREFDIYWCNRPSPAAPVPE